MFELDTFRPTGAKRVRDVLDGAMSSQRHSGSTGFPFGMRRGQPVGAPATSSGGGGSAADPLAACPVLVLVCPASWCPQWGTPCAGALRLVPPRSCSQGSALLAGWLCAARIAIADDPAVIVRRVPVLERVPGHEDSPWDVPIISVMSAQVAPAGRPGAAL